MKRTPRKIPVAFIFIFAVLISLSPTRGVSADFNETAAAQAADQVSRDSLSAMVDFLAIDPATGLLRTRFTLREYELAIVAETLAARLAIYTGNPVDRLTFDVVNTNYAPDSTFLAENIVGYTAGTGEAEGVVLVTAHYDAIGSRSTGWVNSWQTEPAPGANDNGTGVAGVMEAARILPAGTLPFDVMFVLFSGEEIGLLGSEDFVSRYDALYGERIIGMVNLDMLGYRLSGASPGATINIDYRSGFLAELFLAAAGLLAPELDFIQFYPGYANSDHAPFWTARLPAMSIYEPFDEEGGVLFSDYHTLNDLPGVIDFAQVEGILRAAIGFLAGFEGTGQDPEIAMLSKDITLLRRSITTNRREFEMDDEVSVRLWPRHIYGPMIPPGAEMDLTVTMENRSGHQTLHTGTYDIPDLLQAETVEIPLTLEAGDIGEHIIRAELDAIGFDDDPENNSAEIRFGLLGGGPIVFDHSFRPNPMRGSFHEASFCLHLSMDANFVIDILNLEGEKVGSAFIGSGYGVPLQAGLNCLSCGSIFPRVTGLASGIYLYRLRPQESSSGLGAVTGKFAVSN